MKVNYGVAKDVAHTPVSEMREYILKHTTALMLVGGIKAMSIGRVDMGYASKLEVGIKYVDGAPEGVKALGEATKDAIAQILATANFNAVDIDLLEDDLERVRSNWRVNSKPEAEGDKKPCGCGNSCSCGNKSEVVVPEIA